MKRILATILALCMVLSVLVVMPISAGAAGSNVPTQGSPIGANESTAGYHAVTPDPSKKNLPDFGDLTAAPGARKQTDGVKEYQISTPEGLAKFFDWRQASGHYAYYKFYLTAPIDMSKITASAYAGYKTDVPGMQNSGQAFKGSFDGQGYAISNFDMYVPASETSVEMIGFLGLFMDTDENVPTVVENVYLDDTCDFTAEAGLSKFRAAGSVVAWAHDGTTVRNCYSAAKITVNSPCPSYGVGGVVGSTEANCNAVQNCTFAGALSSPSSNVGGVIGKFAGKSISGLVNEGSVTVPTDTAFNRIGGVIGFTSASVSNCINKGTVTVGTATSKNSERVGGVLGELTAVASITNCTNSGIVHGENVFYLGGIVGKVSVAGCTIQNCNNTATVDTFGGYRVGGIVGWASAGGIAIHSCANSGVVTSGRRGDIATDGTTVGGSWAGGIAGHLDSVNNEVLDCVNTGAVTGTGMVAYSSSWVGGIVGSSHGISILRCSNSGAVSSRGNRTGGMIGNTNGSGNVWIQDCVNNARIGSNGANAAGIGGYIEGSGSASGFLRDGTTVVPAGVNIINCTNNGEVVAGGNAGGIAGVVIYTTLISNCVNKGVIDGVNAAAIVCQQALANPLTIYNCKNYSKIIDRTMTVDHVEHNILDYKDAACVYNSMNNDDYVETAQWLGYQVTASYTVGGVKYQDIRFVGTIDSLDYNSVGFNYKVTDTHGEVKKEGSYTCTYVYEELFAEGGNLLASKYRPGGYLFSLTVEKIPVSAGTLTFNVETFAKDTLANGGTVVKGESKSFHHVVGDKTTIITSNSGYTVTLGAPMVVYQSPSNMKQDWGYYQFPRLYSTPDGAIIANWNYSEDTALGGGGSSAAVKNSISYDGGKTWTAISDADASKYVREYNVPTEDGRYFVSFSSGGSYKIPKSQITSKVYASGKTGSTTYNVYLASDIANLTLTDANGKSVTAFKNPNQINMTEYYAETRTTAASTKTLNWNHMPVYGYIDGDYIILTTASSLMGINSRYGMVEKDGVLYYATYTRGFDPKNTSATNFANSSHDFHYGVFVFKSTDGGDTWNCISRISYADLPAGGYYEDGPCEPYMNLMPDGSLVIIARTGGSYKRNEPTVISRSTDGGVTWSKPTAFGTVGVLPQMLTLDCGVTIASYGRPGLFFRTTADKSGQSWNAQTQITDLSPIKTGTAQYEACGDTLSCYYTGLIAIDSNTALLIYSDFYHPDGKGGYTKAIMVRTIDIVAK